ncbi:hypothetical protein CONPUDRAFT_84430 [Coniophora puteana RWD-64-598 SS2]|uniref:Uncharacterized protein n=1 Tax=Coniophora puteana (strain RWD-64-598) TaxID=741705 RepID=A0A5M3MFD2_CONPW|nr:uncharacterized protein CONPUDRAFT_84430 [Coniophora puteana RWD-64-598 SS2]EIW77301.1 hypothetical protein CONPUDRAFT_84430 [Coniophora puteana RWD-64-598 SS2]
MPPSAFRESGRLVIKRLRVHKHPSALLTSAHLSDQLDSMDLFPLLPQHLYVSLDPIPGSLYFPPKELELERYRNFPIILGRDGCAFWATQPSTQKNGYFPYAGSGEEDFGDIDPFHAWIDIEGVVDQNGEAVWVSDNIQPVIVPTNKFPES